MSNTPRDWEEDELFQEHPELLEMARGVASAQDEPVPPGITDDVMSRILESQPARPGVFSRFVEWATRPVTFRVSPFAAAGMSLALALLLFAFLQYGGSPYDDAQQAAAPEVAAPEHGVQVRFTLESDDARSVALIGSFNGWRPEGYVLRHGDAPGLWVIDTVLPPGRHEYSFLVDGKPMADPKAPVAVKDDFGNRNAVLYVPAEQAI